MKKKYIIIISILGVIITILGIILLTKNNILKEKSKLVIIDATYSCTQVKEKFYEDDKHTYSFPCVKSNSIYVKLENGNKMLITDALNSKKVSIDELIEAGLEVYIEDK